MLTISRTFLRIAYDPKSDEELEEIAESAFAVAEQGAREFLPLEEFGTEIRARPGSVELVATIIAAAGTVVAAIANYGSFSDGLQKLVEDSKKVGSFVRTRVVRQLRSRVLSTKVTSGHLTQLDNLLVAVRNGRLERSEATRRAVAILRKAGDEVTPAVEASLEEVFETIPLLPPDRRYIPPPQGHSARIPASVQPEFPELPPAISQAEKPKRTREIVLRRDPGASRIKREEY